MRYADDLAVLVNGQWRNGWLLRAVDRRLREEFRELDLRLNEAKSRVVDLTGGEAFGFLGFTFRRLRSPRGWWWVQKMPAMRQRTALLQKLKEVFRGLDSQPIGQVIAVINPILRGWGELLPDRERGTMLRLCQAVGRAEDTAPYDAGERLPGFRLETVE